MNTTTKMDIELLKTILKMEKEDLFEFLSLEMKRHYSLIDANGIKRNFMFCEGELPIMVIAHLDTVFEDQGYSILVDDYHGYYDTFWEDDYKQIYHDREEGVLWSPDGLGADDRVGVFMIVSLIRQGLKPYILFTTDEETGSLSGKDFAEKYKNKFKDYNIKYLMELDRGGYDDCVFYNCDNPLFVEYIESYGFVKDIGSFTDISVICPVLGVAGVNLSVGYHNEHSKAEIADLFTMSKNFDIIYKMVKESKEIDKFFKYIPRKKVPKAFKIPDPKKEDFDIRIGETEETECGLCESMVKDYLYADGMGKVCLDCFMELYR